MPQQVITADELGQCASSREVPDHLADAMANLADEMRGLESMVASRWGAPSPTPADTFTRAKALIETSFNRELRGLENIIMAKTGRRSGSLSETILRAAKLIDGANL